MAIEETMIAVKIVIIGEIRVTVMAATMVTAVAIDSMRQTPAHRRGR